MKNPVLTPIDIRVLRFGHFEIDAARRQLRLQGSGPATLGSRAFDLLMVLAESRDRVVGKHELLDRVWPGLVVEENNLQVQISALRKLLGPTTIATIPGRGYRLTVTDTDTDTDTDAGPEPEAPGLPAAALPATIDTAAPSNLPAHLPTLHGRDADLAELQALLARHRLVTVTGAGGIGKTRLAQAAAQQALPSFRDGVAWLELAPLSEPALVLASVARTLGVPAPAAASHRELAARVAERCLLLVLDNCEHLVEPVAALVLALLQGAPGVKVLATSQEPLKLTQEQLLRLGSLAVPTDDLRAVTESPAGGDALTLFEARAQAAHPGFVLHAGNLGLALEVCRRLDGIPLAIELAAARLPLLGLEGLRQRLDDRFRVLTAGARLAPPRQQTLLAALAWSHGLLRDDEQRVWRRLGVFKGSFGLEAAQQVAADAGQDGWEVLDRLGTLVDKSLVIAEPGDVPRYRLLESARAFALAQLQAAGEFGLTARRHAQAMRALFEAGRQRRWADSPHALAATLMNDLDNLRAALAWASGQGGDGGDGPEWVALAAASGWFWPLASLTGEGLRACQAALAAIDAQTPPADEAQLLLAHGRLAHQDDASGELAELRRAAELFLGLGDRQNAYLASSVRAQKLAWQYDPEASTLALQEAKDLWSPDWPPTLQESLLVAETYSHEAAGHPEKGQVLMEALVTLMRRHGDARQLNRALAELAENLMIQGKAGEAIVVRREIAQRWGDSQGLDETMNLANLAASLAWQGLNDEALAVARTVMPALQRIDRLKTHLDHLALIACQAGRPIDAAKTIGCADAYVAGTGFGREPSERRARNRVMAILQQTLGDEELHRLCAAGAALPVADAARLALGD